MAVLHVGALLVTLASTLLCIAGLVLIVWSSFTGHIDQTVLAGAAFFICAGQAINNFNTDLGPDRDTDLRQVYLEDFQR